MKEEEWVSTSLFKDDGWAQVSTLFAEWIYVEV
jgi:hypothetical protein